MSDSVLLLGHRGMLGRAWAQKLQSHSARFDAPDRDQIDLARPETISPGIDERCRLVINCAAFTDVDGCETKEDLAGIINGEGPGAVARRCARIGATFVHYSTDYVFNGRSNSPFETGGLRDPINAYGRTKAAGESLIESSGCRYLIIRTSWLYAPWGKNFVRTIVNLARQRDRLSVVDDQRGTPTSAQHLVEVSQGLLDNAASGIFHVSDGGACSWYEFAIEIVRQSGSACVIEPCTTKEFPRPAPRPANSVLDLSKTEKLLGPMPTWRTNLAKVMPRLEPTRQTTKP